MPLAFEERFAEHFDALYRVALFLCGGHEERGERLLAGVALEALRESSSTEERGPESWADGMVDRLLAHYLARGRAVRSAGTGSSVGIPWRTLDRVPLEARAALWLVVVERRTEEDARVRLGVSAPKLDVLLDYVEVVARDLDASPGNSSKSARA